MTLEIFLSSAVISVIVTWIVNSWLANQNYKLEYHKQLITKRIDAYESAEAVARALGRNVVRADGRRHMILFSSRKDFVDFFASLLIAMDKSIWFTADTAHILLQINETLLQANADYGLETQDMPDVFIEAGTAYRDELVNLRNDLLSHIRNDLRHLHNINAFIKI